MKSAELANKVVTDFVLKALEQDICPWKKPFFCTAFGNPLTGSRYSGSNVFFLGLFQAMYKVESNFFVTPKSVFKLWNRKGSFVKDEFKDENGKLITCPLTYFSIIDVNKKQRKKDPSIKKKTFPMLKFYSVLNIDMLVDEAKELVLAKAKTKELELDNRPNQDAEQIILNWEDQPETRITNTDRAFYVPSQDRMEIPSIKNHIGTAEYYSTFFHESIHATGHGSRLNRSGITDFARFGDHKYSYEELIAEMGAAMLCQVAGIETTLDNSAAYLKSWIKKLESNPTWILKAAKEAEKAAKWILGEKEEKKEIEEK